MTASGHDDPSGRVLLAAGEWGFGPAVTAELIADAGKDRMEIDLLATGAAATYAAGGRGFEHCRVVESVDDARPCDLVVSVVEPSSVIWAKQRGVPAVAIDNVFWHWDWDQQQLADATVVLARSLDRTPNEVVARLRALGGYLEYSPLYLSADRVLWQRVAPPNERLAHSGATATFVDPLVRPIGVSQKEDIFVVSLSGGLLTPATSADDRTTYLRLLRAALRTGIESGETHGWRFEVAAPQELTALAESTLGIPARAYDHGSFTDLLGRARALAAPTGLSTTIEAVQAGVSLFSLPELHDGNLANYHGLRRAADEDERVFRETFPAALLGDDGTERSIKELFESYRHILDATDDPFIRRSGSAFDEFVLRSMSNEARNGLVRAQRSLVLGVAGGLDGVAQVIAVIADALHERGRSQ